MRSRRAGSGRQSGRSLRTGYRRRSGWRSGPANRLAPCQSGGGSGRCRYRRPASRPAPVRHCWGFPTGRYGLPRAAVRAHPAPRHAAATPASPAPTAPPAPHAPAHSDPRAPLPTAVVRRAAMCRSRAGEAPARRPGRRACRQSRAPSWARRSARLARWRYGRHCPRTRPAGYPPPRPGSRPSRRAATPMRSWSRRCRRRRSAHFDWRQGRTHFPTWA